MILVSNFLNLFFFIYTAMPQGTMPVLEIDGKYKFSQSTTIARHLAREFSKYSFYRSKMNINFDML